MRKTNPSNVNLAAIAQRLNVSISTVSRVLRNPNVKKKSAIHQQVFDTAKAIGYFSKDRSRLLSRVKPLHVLALGLYSVAYVDQRYLAGLSRTAVALNVAILSHHLSLDSAESILDRALQPVGMRYGTLDGIVLIHRWPNHIVKALAADYRLVSIVHDYPGLPVDVIGTDDRQGVLALVEHLAARGHEKIGYFGFCPEVTWARSRFAAYVEAMTTLGHPFEVSHAVEIDLNEALSVTPFPRRHWVRKVEACRQAGVTAWIAASAATGLTLQRYFNEEKIKVPDEVEITCFHRQRLPSSDLGRLTAVDVADEEFGASALRRLVHRVRNPEESRRSIIIPMKFSQGDTTKVLAETSPANDLSPENPFLIS